MQVEGLSACTVSLPVNILEDPGSARRHGVKTERVLPWSGWLSGQSQEAGSGHTRERAARLVGLAARFAQINDEKPQVSGLPPGPKAAGRWIRRLSRTGPVTADRVVVAGVHDRTAAVAQVPAEPIEADVVVDHEVSEGAAAQGHADAGVPADQVGRSCALSGR